MDIDAIFSGAVGFYEAHKIIAVILVGVVLVFAFSRPRETFKLLALILIVSGIFYAVSVFGNMVTTGAQGKDTMINKSQAELGD